MEAEDIPKHVVKMKKTLESVYCRVWEILNISYQQQKEHYDKKIHGDAFEEGDMVWLHTTVISRGKSKNCTTHRLVPIA